SWPSGALPKFSGNLVLVRCGDPKQPAGVDLGLVERNARALSRPYPRAFPSPAQFASDPANRTLVMDGSGQGGLDVWLPGAARPSVTVTGLVIDGLRPVAGGWRLTARTTAPSWRLRAATR